jgi:hypothetical protein
MPACERVRAGQWRDYARSTASHNTVTIADEDQCEFWKSFRVARRAQVTRHHYSETAGGFLLEASHDGYRHLAGAPIHTRRFDATPTSIRINDRVSGGDGQPVRARLLLHPDFQAEPTSGGLVLATAEFARCSERATRRLLKQAGGARSSTRGSPPCRSSCTTVWRRAKASSSSRSVHEDPLRQSVFPPEMGAPAARVHELSREWVRLGHQVTVLTGFPNHPDGRMPAAYRRQMWRLTVRESSTASPSCARPSTPPPIEAAWDGC